MTAPCESCERADITTILIVDDEPFALCHRCAEAAVTV